jgi:peroxiredoxin
MRRLQSLFITAYIALLAVTVAWTALGLAAAPARLAHWGVAVASGVPLLFFARLFLFPTARTSANLNWLPTVGGVGVFMVLAGKGSTTSVVLALANGVLLTMAYIHWYSRFGHRIVAALSVGNHLPELTLEGLDGHPRSTHELTRQTALWMFYRGNWCPLCMAQIREVAAGYRQLHERGVAVYLVSPQPPDHSLELSQRFDAPMHFLRDRDNLSAARLGILAEDGLPVGLQLFGYDSDVPMPTVFITAPGGRIVYSDLTENYRIRPEPADFIAALDRAGL